MFSDLAGIRADLHARLAPHLPGWKIVDHLAAPVDSVVPVLYLEFTGLGSSVNGQPLPRDTVACRIDITVAGAGSSDEDAADAHILRLTHVLQAFDDILWDAARKVSLKNGPFAWVVEATVLSTGTLTPITDPDSEEE